MATAKKAGKYRDTINSSNITDPKSKDRDDNGFPFPNREATGILRKKMVEFVTDVRSQGGVPLTEDLRTARKDVTEIVLDIARNYQVTDAAAVIYASCQYELDDFKTKGEKLTATNQFVQAVYTTLVSGREDMCAIDTQEAEQLGIEKILAILTCLSEAICQVSKRNEGKSAFVHGEGYINKKKGHNDFYLKSLKEAMTELFRANSLPNYWYKLAREEKHNLSTLMRILQKTVCPTFAPKDYLPSTQEECTENEADFMYRSKMYFEHAYDAVLTTMEEARKEEERKVASEDEDFSTIYNGDLLQGELFSRERAMSNSEFQEVDSHFEDQLFQFSQFIHYSQTVFVERGQQYFSSRSAFLDSNGGLDSNLAMTSAPLGIVETIGEGGVFLGEPNTKVEIETSYEKLRQESGMGNFPEITVRSWTDSEAEADAEFVEAEFVKSMSLDQLKTGKSVVEFARYQSIAAEIHFKTESEPGVIDFQDICVVVEAGDEDADAKFSTKQKEEEDDDEEEEQPTPLMDSEEDEEDEEEEQKEGEVLEVGKSSGKKKEGRPNDPLAKATSNLFTRKLLIESGYFDNVAMEKKLVEGSEDVKGRKLIFIKQTLDLYHSTLEHIEKRQSPTKGEINKFVSDRAPMMGMGTEEEDVALRLSLLDLVTVDTSKLRQMVTDLKEGTEGPLDHYHVTILNSFKTILWRYFNVKAELAGNHYQLIEGEFKVIENILLHYQQNGSLTVHAEKIALVRMLFDIFFISVDHTHLPEGKKKIELVRNLSSLPLEVDMDVSIFESVMRPVGRNYRIAAEICNFIPQFVQSEIHNLRAKERASRSENGDSWSKKRIFSSDTNQIKTDKNLDIDVNPAQSASVNAFCLTNKMQVVNYKNTQSNCLFWTLKIVTRDNREPDKMRKDIIEEIAQTEEFDHFFLEVAQTSKDRDMKTKADWMLHMEKETTYGDQIAATVILNKFKEEVQVYHTNGYSVTYNGGIGKKCALHVLCQNSIHFMPVKDITESGEVERSSSVLLAEMEKYVTAASEDIKEKKSFAEKKGDKDDKKSQVRSKLEKKALENLLIEEIKRTQPEWNNRGYHIEMRLGEDSFTPKEKDDGCFDFVHEYGGKTFNADLEGLVEYMTFYDCGCTVGNGKLLPSYIVLMKEPNIVDLVNKAVDDWNSPEAKSLRTKKTNQESEEEEGDKGGSKGDKKKKKEKKVVVPGSWSSNKKMVFNCDVLLVGPKTYTRILMAMVSSVTKFYRRQILDFEDFSLMSVDWVDRRAGTGIPMGVWMNLGKAFVRNMKKKFKKELYLFPLLPRKQTIVNLCGAANLISTELSYMMNGGGTSAFNRLCELCVMSCKADIPENSVHAIHQFLLNAVDREKFMSNKTTYTEDLWQNIKFRDQDDDLKKAFGKGKPGSEK